MNIVEKALAILRAQEAVSLNEGVLLLARLLAWQKISRAERIGEEYRFKRCSAQDVWAVFKALSELRELGENAKAFHAGDALTKIPPDVLERLFELLINPPDNYAELLAALHDALAIASPDSEMHTIPSELVELVTSLAAPGEGERVYCPFDMSVRVAEQAAMNGCQVSVEVQDDTPWPYLVRILLENRLDVRQGHPVNHPAWTEGDKLAQFDVVMAIPPIGQKYTKQDVANGLLSGPLMQRFLSMERAWSNADMVHLVRFLDQCSGRMVIVIPPNILFRNSGNERAFKQYLVDEGILQTVIALPKRTFGCGSALNAAFHILVMNRSQPKRDGVLMVNASSFVTPRLSRGNPLTGRDKLRGVAKIVELVKKCHDTEFSRVIKFSEFAVKDYNLLPLLYIHKVNKNITSENHKAVYTLGNIADFIRPQMLKGTNSGSELLEAGISDIGENGELYEPKKIIKVDASSLKQTIKQKIQAGDVLLGIRGAVGRVALVPDSCGNNWIAGQAFLILRVKPAVFDPVVLYRYLVSPVGQAELDRRVSGSTVPLLQTGTLKELPVPEVSEEEKTAILLRHESIQRKYRAIERIRGKIQTLNQEHWPMDK